MLYVLAATIIALVVTYYLSRSYRPDPAQLHEARPHMMTMGVQIICGDCSGDHDQPVKTYLDRYGRCSLCGGSSYILASNRAIYAQQLRAARLAESHNAGSGGRVIPFELPLARAAQSEKIAV